MSTEWLSVADTAKKIAAGELTAVRVLDAYVARIGNIDRELGAYLALDRGSARRAAVEIDRKRTAGEPLGPLAGVPVGLKDVLVTRGLETTAASKILQGWIPPYDATVVEKLRAAGAIVLGKLNCDEFAMGSSTERSAYKRTRNPWDTARVPGGSSGGSSAAVAAGLCAASLGTDTGGSIRQPAAFCGVVGLKPTYGRVSRWGVVAFASSLDQVGPLTRTVEDAALMLEVIAGFDPRDSTSLDRAGPELSRRSAHRRHQGPAHRQAARIFLERGRSGRPRGPRAHDPRPCVERQAPRSSTSSAAAHASTPFRRITSSRPQRPRPTSRATTASGSARRRPAQRICSSSTRSRAARASVREVKPPHHARRRTRCVPDITTRTTRRRSRSAR